MKRIHALAAAALLAFAALPAGAQPARRTPGCELPNADTTVHGIKLGDDASTKKVLGEDYRTVIDDPASDFAWWISAGALRFPNQSASAFDLGHAASLAVQIPMKTVLSSNFLSTFSEMESAAASLACSQLKE